jgi:hypothetical protein
VKNQDLTPGVARIHPRSEAHPAILANIWHGLAPLLR